MNPRENKSQKENVNHIRNVVMCQSGRKCATYKVIFEELNLVEGYVYVEDGIGGYFRVVQRWSVRVDSDVVQNSSARVDPLGPDVVESVAMMTTSCCFY